MIENEIKVRIWSRRENKLWVNVLLDLVFFIFLADVCYLTETLSNVAFSSVMSAYVLILVAKSVASLVRRDGSSDRREFIGVFDICVALLIGEI